jgi:uncharacterized protein (TIGR03083 family)
MSSESAPVEAWLAAARASHRRVADLVAPLSDEELAGPSYADEWSIAEVLSHLGSGAEIFSLILAAGLAGRPAPGGEEFQPVWARWNSKPPPAQAHDAIVADAAFLAQLDALDGQQRADWQIELFGGSQDLAGLLRLRLGEHAVHTWDVAVSRDPSATVAPDAVDLLIDVIDSLVSRVAKPADPPIRVLVSTQGPTRQFQLQATSGEASLTPHDGADANSDAQLRLPAEALVRLVYGRLDPQHTPPIDASGIDLDVLRRIFPGF